MRRSLAIAQRELLEIRHTPSVLLIYIGLPLLTMPFLKGASRSGLLLGGAHQATGGEQVVPGMAVLAGLFVIELGGMAFYREYIWQTWGRLRASRARRWEIMLGKTIPFAVVYLAVVAATFVVGALVVGLHLSTRAFALTPVLLAFVLFLVALGLALVSVCRTLQLFNVVRQLLAILAVAVGGALVPIETLPSGLRHIAPASPGYWVMRSTNAVLLDGKGVSAVWLSTLVLVAISVGLIGVAVFAFRFDREQAASAV